MNNSGRANKFISLVLSIIITLDFFPIICKAEGNYNKNRVVVSMGDSYSSGEGIEPFYGQDKALEDKVTDPDWLAHRSLHSWAGQLSLPDIGLLSDSKDTNWFFVAASGAKIDNLFDAQKKTYSRSSYSGTESLPAQVNVLYDLDVPPDYITITIGGNDADFGGIIKNAAMPEFVNPCSLTDKLNSVWKRFYASDGIREKLKNAYVALDGVTSSKSRIIVAGYPQLLNPNGGFCGLFSKDEAFLINENVSQFNDAIESVVDEVAYNFDVDIYFVSVETAFKNHEAYSDDEYINKVKIGSQDQDLKDNLSFSEYSIHPNYAGSCAYARCVQAKIDELEAISGSSHSIDISNSVDNKNAKDAFRDFLRERYENADTYYNGLPVHYHDAPDNSGDTWMNYAIDDFDSDGQEELIVHISYYENEFSTNALQGLLFYEYKNNNVELEHSAYFLEEMVLDPGFLIFYDNGQVYMERELKSLTIFVFNESMRQEFNLIEGDRIVYTVEDYNDMKIRRSIGGGYAFTSYVIISNESYSREKNQLLSGNILNTTMLPVNKSTLW